jgi:AcrR family transcriptional regulator
MARVKSHEKRAAILRGAAAHEIVKSRLGAPTAKIARRAGVAAGTLFTYFATKEELLNELYLDLKGEVYARNFLMEAGADEADSNGQGCCRNQNGARVKHAAQCAHVSSREKSTRNEECCRNGADASRPDKRRWERGGVERNLQKQRE